MKKKEKKTDRANARGSSYLAHKKSKKKSGKVATQQHKKNLE